MSLLFVERKKRHEESCTAAHALSEAAVRSEDPLRIPQQCRNVCEVLSSHPVHLYVPVVHGVMHEGMHAFQNDDFGCMPYSSKRKF